MCEVDVVIPEKTETQRGKVVHPKTTIMSRTGV